MKRVIRNGVAMGLALLAGVLFAEAPQWWIDRGVLDTNAAPEDYAPVNQGQVKFMAEQAREEFDVNLPLGAGTNIDLMVGSFTTNQNYIPANIGQLKYVAEPFYDRLIGIGFLPGYPWVSATNDADYAMANVGQFKNIFSFDLSIDSDTDGLPDVWEYDYFQDMDEEGSDDTDHDGLKNTNEYAEATNPENYDTDGDLLADGAELDTYASDPLDGNSDGDTSPDSYDFLLGGIQGSSHDIYTINTSFSGHGLELDQVDSDYAYHPVDFFYTENILGLPPETKKWKVAESGMPLYFYDLQTGEITSWSGMFVDIGGSGRPDPEPEGILRLYCVGLARDKDHDGLGDAYEVLITKTSPDMWDTPDTYGIHNGISDGDEDFDGDGKCNALEYNSKVYDRYEPYYPGYPGGLQVLDYPLNMAYLYEHGYPGSFTNPIVFSWWWEEHPFPLPPYEYRDATIHGSSDPWDPDSDDDGYSDGSAFPSGHQGAQLGFWDKFPLDPSAYRDTDNDGYPDEVIGDSNSEPPLVEDAFPLDPIEWLDTDGDGIGNNADTDDDGDGIPDVIEANIQGTTGEDGLLILLPGSEYRHVIEAALELNAYGAYGE